MDRGKKGAKCGLVVESHGLPVGIVVSGANTHDIKPLEKTLQSIVTAHPEGTKLYLDAGYVGAQKAVEGMGYEARIRSWLNRFRKLLVRCEKKARNYQALVEFACAVIIWRNLIPLHPSLIPG
jgi:IS5 family transposase